MNKESERVKYVLLNWSHLQLAREYEKLENIIKEVRERLIKPSKFIERPERLKLLEILDKER